MNFRVPVYFIDKLSIIQVLFRFAIAFLKKSDQEILKQEDGLQLNRYLRTIGEKMTNVKQISSVRFFNLHISSSLKLSYFWYI